MSATRRIKLTAEENTPGLFDEETYELIYPEDINLPDSLVKRIEQFAKDYAGILPLTEEQIKTTGREDAVRALDTRGIELTRDISRHLGGKFHLRYFSAAFLEFTDV